MKIPAALLVLGLGFTALQATSAFEILKRPVCEPGYNLVAETVMVDVTRDVCKIVPDVKKVKKWVYSSIPDPSCIHKTGKCENGCQGPYCRYLLVKKEIVVEECNTTKCVTEKITEKVPVTIFRKVPCDSVSPIPPMPPARMDISADPPIVVDAPLPARSQGGPVPLAPLPQQALPERPNLPIDY